MDVPIHAQPDQGTALEPWVGDLQEEPEYGVFDQELDSQDCFPHLILEGFQCGRHYHIGR